VLIKADRVKHFADEQVRCRAHSHAGGGGHSRIMRLATDCSSSCPSWSLLCHTWLVMFPLGSSTPRHAVTCACCPWMRPPSLAGPARGARGAGKGTPRVPQVRAQAHAVWCQPASAARVCPGGGHLPGRGGTPRSPRHLSHQQGAPHPVHGGA
jgi:hypothetical protein